MVDLQGIFEYFLYASESGSIKYKLLSFKTFSFDEWRSYSSIATFIKSHVSASMV